jgi:toluene monooxygenase system protein B
MEIPLSTNFEGDFILKLVVVDDDDTMDAVAQKTASHTVGRTVQARPGGVLRVRRQGASAPFERNATVREARLVVMECIEVYYEEQGAK